MSLPFSNDQIARIGDQRGDAGAFENGLNDFEFAPGGDFAPVHDSDLRRDSRAAPLSVSSRGALREALHQRIFADGVALLEAVHDRQLEENIGESFRVPEPGGRFSIVFGELQRIGKQESVEARCGAGGDVTRIEAREALFFGTERGLREQLADRRAIASRRVRPARRWLRPQGGRGLLRLW